MDRTRLGEIVAAGAFAIAIAVFSVMGPVPWHLAYIVWGICAVAFLFGAYLRFVPGKEKDKKAMADEKGYFHLDQSIKADNNSGTISPTYNNNINVDPTPRFQPLSDLRQIQNADGTVTTSTRFRISPAGRHCVIGAHGHNVIAMDIVQAPLGEFNASNMSMKSMERGPDYIRIRFDNPHGVYELVVTTRGAWTPNFMQGVI